MSPTGILFHGIHQRGINGFVSTVNIPPVTDRTIQKMEREAGSYIEAAAERSCQNALDLEIELTR